MALTDKEVEQAVLATKITLALTVAEVNMILGLIGKYPFEEVNGLVARVHEQGQPQIAAFVTKLQEAEVAKEAAAPTIVE